MQYNRIKEVLASSILQVEPKDLLVDKLIEENK